MKSALFVDFDNVFTQLRALDPAAAERFARQPVEWMRWLTGVLEIPEGHVVLQTLRTHDQFNTTIYGLDDRYRGIHGGRRVVFVSRADLDELGLRDGQTVDLVGDWSDGIVRRADGFRIVEYSTPKGCVAAYYPETNPLIPLDSQALGSGTPTSKWVVIRMEPRS